MARVQATSGSFIDTEIATFNSSLAVDATGAEQMAVHRCNPDFGSQRTTYGLNEAKTVRYRIRPPSVPRHAGTGQGR